MLPMLTLKKIAFFCFSVFYPLPSLGVFPIVTPGRTDFPWLHLTSHLTTSSHLQHQEPTTSFTHYQRYPHIMGSHRTSHPALGRPHALCPAGTGCPRDTKGHAGPLARPCDPVCPLCLPPGMLPRSEGSHSTTSHASGTATRRITGP